MSEPTEGTEKKARIIREDVKELHTSHWDLDYVSREELERLMIGENGSGTAATGDQGEEPKS